MLQFRITSGRSNENWISFTAGSHTSRAIREPNGEIKTETVNESSVPSKWEEIKYSVVHYLYVIFAVFAFYIMPFIKGYKLNPMIRNNELGSNYYLISAVLLSIISVIQILTLIINDPRKKLRRNHGAEHKVFTAYNKLKRIPTINEAKTFPRICNVCGVTVFSALITGQLIGFFLYTNYGIMLSEKFLFFVPLLLHSIFPFNFLGKLAQFFTTDEPNDDNIELAIAALTELMHAENPGYFIAEMMKDRFFKSLF